MRRLLLLRHAKSDWSVSVADEQRQLNNRGQKAAARMGRYIQDEDLTPHKVLCSTAMRAAETWRLVQPNLDPAPHVEHIAALYDFGSGTALLDIIRRHGNNAQSLMLIGHNPSIEGLAALLSDRGNRTALSVMHRKYPTTAIAVIDFEFDDWHDVSPGSGILVSFTRPKDLTD